MYWPGRGGRSPWQLRNRLRWVRQAVAFGCALMWAALTLEAPHDAVAAIAPQLQLNAEERAELARIEAYLNGFRSVRSDFAQWSSNGEEARGRLYLARPGKLRIDYQPPAPILVIADGTFLIYYDRKLEQVSYVPLASTPASILLDKHISLAEGALMVTGFERAEGTIFVTVARADKPGEGSITLSFREEPLALQQWSVTDPQGIVTVVTLLQPRFDVDLDESLFSFQDPRAFAPRPSP